MVLWHCRTDATPVAVAVSVENSSCALGSRRGLNIKKQLNCWLLLLRTAVPAMWRSNSAPHRNSSICSWTSRSRCATLDAGVTLRWLPKRGVRGRRQSTNANIMAPIFSFFFFQVLSTWPCRILYVSIINWPLFKSLTDHQSGQRLV